MAVINNLSYQIQKTILSTFKETAVTIAGKRQQWESISLSYGSSST
ncbi:hypothetical protein [Okeania sp. SIO1I7]|nr:hypothetical protein [Okeania sp. SIO1I7]NET26926.1 hypothetical protein [Okeania sp. SIO1I7]